jgi:hypothetical protein
MAVLLALFAAPAMAQQDCVIGSHKRENGQCGAYVLNMCQRALVCTIYVDGFTAQGAKLSESRPVTLQHQGSTTVFVEGVARCGNFDVQCSPAGNQQRRR